MSAQSLGFNAGKLRLPTKSEYVILIVLFTAKLVKRTPLSVILKYIACLVIFECHPFMRFHTHTHTYKHTHSSSCVSYSQPNITTRFIYYLDSSRRSIQMHKTCCISYVLVIFSDLHSIYALVLYTDLYSVLLCTLEVVDLGSTDYLAIHGSISEGP